MSLKDRISSPLEAGASILDAHHLPPHLNSALEYASKRLARKALHVTLLVVRREYQLPSSIAPSPCASAFTSPLVSPVPSLASSVSTAASTPCRPTFTSAPVAAIKHLVRSNTCAHPPSLDRPKPILDLHLHRSKTVSPAFSLSSIDSASSRIQWPLSPPLSASPMPMTPATPATAASSTTDASSTAGATQNPNPFGIRLVHTTPLRLREERVLRQTIEKAERKFRVGTDWLPPAQLPSAAGLPTDLVRRSLAQNEVLFSADGLALLALDHLYTFKAALAAYSRARTTQTTQTHQTQAPEPRRWWAPLPSAQLEDAVDELRRLVLADGRRRLRKTRLLAAYGWLGLVDETALADVCRMYARAYGGVDGDCGVEDDVDGDLNVRRPASEEEEEEVGLAFTADEAIDAWAGMAAEQRDEGEEEAEREREREALEQMLLRTTPRLRAPPSPKGPALKLQTTFEKPKPAGREVEIVGDEKVWAGPDGEEDEDEDEELTARPGKAGAGFTFWNNSVSIDGVLNNSHEPSHPEVGDGLGPMTPNGYDDISPITRGEWGFLTGEAWSGGRTVAVETC